jgi:VIT1/CCC1 family predicted Fe2+/Mn2+ transporter
MVRIHKEKHRTGVGGWLRAAVLGANDGVISIASLVVGVAAASASRGAILTAGLAGLVGGALSMAAGEYVSVSSQRDVEKGDLAMEKEELETQPESELHELQEMLAKRGLTDKTARIAAEEMTAHDALAAHATEELGISLDGLARPIQASVVSAVAFSVGAALPVLAIAIAPESLRIWATSIAALLALVVLGAWSARLGRVAIPRAVLRVIVGGVLAMGITAGIGYLFGASVA